MVKKGTYWTYSRYYTKYYSPNCPPLLILNIYKIFYKAFYGAFQRYFVGLSLRFSMGYTDGIGHVFYEVVERESQLVFYKAYRDRIV